MTTAQAYNRWRWRRACRARRRRADVPSDTAGYVMYVEANWAVAKFLEEFDHNA